MPFSIAVLSSPRMSSAPTPVDRDRYEIPALPGAANTAETRGENWSFQTSACSRAPLPTTRTRTGLLPLDSGRRLRGDVVDDAIDAGYFVHDARRDSGQHVVRQPSPIGRH